MQAAQANDDTAAPPVAPPLDVAGLVGRWTKTNEGAQWIRRLAISVSDDLGAPPSRRLARRRPAADESETLSRQPARTPALRVHVEGDAPPSPRDWGTVTAESLFANGILSSTGSAFIAKFDFDDFDTELQANANLGLLVVACFTRFKDASGRADLFTREFFWREDE